MTVLLENSGVYRGGSVGRPRKCTAKLYADRVEVVSPEGEPITVVALADVRTAKASGAAVMLKGDPFKAASIEFMSTGTKILLLLLGVLPLLIVMFVGQGRKTAVAWSAKIEELRTAPPTSAPTT